MALKDLNTMENLAPRVKKSTGTRRLTVSKNDEVGTLMESALTPFEVGKLLKDHGVTEEEIMDRASKAPNFGQFRMVAGNRLRGIISRTAVASGKGETLTKSEAAYPKGRRAAKATVSARADAAKGETTRKAAGKKAAGKKVSKKTAGKREPAAKSSKKTTKKSSKKSAPAATDGSIGEDFRDRIFHKQEALNHARSFGSTLQMVREFGSREAAMAYCKRLGEDDLIVHNGTDEVEGDRWVLATLILKKEAPMEK